MPTYIDEGFDELYIVRPSTDWTDEFSFQHNENKKTISPRKLTYPNVLYPFSLLEINRLQPSLPEKPKEPKKPQEPYKPSEKYETGGSFFWIFIIGLAALLLLFVGKNLGGGSLLFFLLIAVTCIPFGIYLTFDNCKDKEKHYDEYPSKLARYNTELKQYQQKKEEYEKSMIEYKNQCLKYEEDKKEILSTTNINLFRDKILHDRLKQGVTPVSNEATQKKGISESYFYSLLTEYFGDKILINLSFSHNGKIFFPDLIYWDKSINLIIDIEIDEPYVGYSGMPIHYVINRKDYYSEHISTSTIDDDRDRTINNAGWIIVKFAEQQIFQNALGCIKLLNSIIENSKILNLYYNSQEILTPVDRWTKDEAHGMGFKRFRYSYIPKEYHELLSNWDISNQQLIKQNTDNFVLTTQEKPMVIKAEIITQIQQERIYHYAINHLLFVSRIVAINYPINYELFEKNNNLVVNVWDSLSRNESLQWSIEFIDRNIEKRKLYEIFRGESDFYYLSRNKSLPWSINLIEKYKEYWNWGEFSKSLPQKHIL